MCTEWDKWHRLAITVKRAADGTPMAQELQDITQIMDSMFGVNEGTAIFKACADAIGLKKQSTFLPGATRKDAALEAEPGNFLTHLKAYAAGLQVRKDWKRAGHSSFHISTLEAAGRRATSVDLVAFALLYRDLIRRAVAPVAKFSQCVQEPWLARAALDDWQARLLGLASVVRSWREMLRITFLLRQWLSSRQVDLLIYSAFLCVPGRFLLERESHDATSNCLGAWIACVHANIPRHGDGGNSDFQRPRAAANPAINRPEQNLSGTTLSVRVSTRHAQQRFSQSERVSHSERNDG